MPHLQSLRLADNSIAHLGCMQVCNPLQGTHEAVQVSMVSRSEALSEYWGVIRASRARACQHPPVAHRVAFYMEEMRLMPDPSLLDHPQI